NNRGEWDHLTPIVFSTFTKDGDSMVLTSATTRTPGLVANIDIAPTVLKWLGAEAPPEMTGHPIQIANRVNARALLSRMDTQVTPNAHATVPIFAVLGGVAVLIVFGGLTAFARGRSAAPFAFGILFLMNMPLAMLFCAAFVFPRVYLLAICMFGYIIALT